MFHPYRIILGSKSPRRQELLKELEIQFQVIVKNVEEHYPPHLKRKQIALYLCQQKASAFEKELVDNTIVITADTIVCLNDQILNKPKDNKDAVRMLQLLSGKKHEVITAVCLKSINKTVVFSVETSVYFKSLTTEKINNYINQCQPYDKAGAYGIQEYTVEKSKYNQLIEKIDGSYSNVVGLPVEELYEELKVFII